MVKILRQILEPLESRVLPNLLPSLMDVVHKNDHTSWCRLFLFSSRCLHTTSRGGHRWSLSRTVNEQIRNESDPPPLLPSRSISEFKKPLDPLMSLAARVSVKIEEGDFKGAIRLAVSDDKVAPV